ILRRRRCEPCLHANSSSLVRNGSGGGCFGSGGPVVCPCGPFAGCTAWLSPASTVGGAPWPSARKSNRRLSLFASLRNGRLPTRFPPAGWNWYCAGAAYCGSGRRLTSPPCDACWLCLRRVSHDAQFADLGAHLVGDPSN